MKPYSRLLAFLFVAGITLIGSSLTGGGLTGVVRAAESLPAPPPPSEDPLFTTVPQDDLAIRMAQMERELETLRQRVSGDRFLLSGARQNVPSACDALGPCCDRCDACDGGCLMGNSCLCGGAGCDGCGLNNCANGGGCWEAVAYGGVEFAILEPHVGALRFPAAGVTVTPDHDFEFTPRVYAGFETETGLGGQLTYWELETTDPNVSTLGISTELDMMTLDVDVRQRGDFGNWSFQVGAGLRYGRSQLDIHNLLGFNERIRGDFEGFGPSLLANVRRPIGCGGWALVGNARASFLFGDTDVTISSAPAMTLAVDEHLLQIWEGQFGLEWSGMTSDESAIFFARAMIEAQVWEFAPIAGLVGTDLGFFGPTASMGFVF